MPTKNKTRQQIRNESDDDEDKRNQSEEEEDEETRNQSEDEEEERENKDDDEETRNQSDDEEDDEETRNEGNGRKKKKATAKRPSNRAATLADLKAAMPNADSDFLIECMDKRRTVVQALNAYTLHLEEQMKDMEASTKRPGVRALGGNAKGQSEDTGDPIAQWNQKVEERMKQAKCPKHQAVQHVAKQNPELRQAFVEAWNNRN